MRGLACESILLHGVVILRIYYWKLMIPCYKEWFTTYKKFLIKLIFLDVKTYQYKQTTFYQKGSGF